MAFLPRALALLLGALPIFSAAHLPLAARSPSNTSSSLNASSPHGAAAPYTLKRGPLDTPWTADVGTSPWPQHPRPQLYRPAWTSLNGLWTFQAADGLDDVFSPPSGPLDQEVLVPSCVESALSGLQAVNTTYMWYQTTFRAPDGWAPKKSRRDGDRTRDRVLLHFEAVDYEATVFLNGEEVGFHRGGYFGWTVDVTDCLDADGGDNELTVFVFDPTDMAPYVIPLGKQTRTPSHIYYTPCSGIWQTVWLERAPAEHVSALVVAADMDGVVTATVYSSDNATGTSVSISVIDAAGKTVATGKGVADEQFTFRVPDAQLWTPDSPHLYNLSITLGADTVHSYTGFRTVSSGKVDGVQRPLLNGEFVFLFGPLDQGYWPDGIYTPPTYEAMVWDLQLIKSLGMNMVRKHIKVEPHLFYRACDEIGLMVIQDMPSMTYQIPNADQQQEFERQLEMLVGELANFPSIVTWVIYNEGWGQIRADGNFPEFDLVSLVRSIDPLSRLIDATTGWFDHGAGDFSDNHHYAGAQCGTPFYSILSSPWDPSRIGFQGEFGGLGNNVSLEHLWNVPAAIAAIDQTYELNADLDAFNWRAGDLLTELRAQVETYACSGAVWTQTVDVEGEVNGLATYDRRLVRVDRAKWRGWIEALYQAARGRGGYGAGKSEVVMGER